MTASSSSMQLLRLREDVAHLRSAVEDAVYTAQEALRGVQRVSSDVEERHAVAAPPSQALSEAVLDEHLRAFEAYIIARVREETARIAAAATAPASASASVMTERSLGEPHTASATSSSSVTGRRLELQLEAQRTRGTAMEQRLGQLEAKLNALMTDVVAQSQREAAHHKQLASMVHEHVSTEMHAVAGAAKASVASASPSGSVVDVSVVHHMTTALAAMHERVEEQHAELLHFQQQHFTLMTAVVEQLDGLKRENASLRQEVQALKVGLRHPKQAAALCDEEDDDEAPVVWPRPGS